MNRQVIGIGLLCLATCGCGPASQVKDSADPATPTAPALSRKVAGAEPGPKDPDAPTDFTTTPSGLKYRVLRKGTGPKPTKSNEVVVNYKGWLDDGTVFDQSYGGEPLSFGPARPVIPGWVEGVTYVGDGGMIELEIPPDLGYGPGGMPPVIPGNSTLHFIVEVLEVK